MNYPIIEPEDITENILYCSKHKEYFSNNCSECMLDANDPDTISKAKTDTRLELAKAVREIENPYQDNNPAWYSDLSIDHRNAFEAMREAVLKLIEERRE
ncbi:MAG TPA: hypothetical protein VMR45_03210 [Patescibacteria group bacterium]|nr:hypothetical protein [Patescibacteria group bacterium]